MVVLLRPDELLQQRMRLAAAEHARLDKGVLPLAIGPLRQYLTTQLPDGLKWELAPDCELSYDHAGSVAMRAAYEDLIARSSAP